MNLLLALIYNAIIIYYTTAMVCIGKEIEIGKSEYGRLHCVLFIWCVIQCINKIYI